MSKADFETLGDDVYQQRAEDREANAEREAAASERAKREGGAALSAVAGETDPEEEAARAAFDRTGEPVTPPARDAEAAEFDAKLAAKRRKEPPEPKDAPAATEPAKRPAKANAGKATKPAGAAAEPDAELKAQIEAVREAATDLARIEADLVDAQAQAKNAAERVKGLKADRDNAVRDLRDAGFGQLHLPIAKPAAPKGKAAKPTPAPEPEPAAEALEPVAAGDPEPARTVKVHGADGEAWKKVTMQTACPSIPRATLARLADQDILTVGDFVKKQEQATGRGQLWYAELKGIGESKAELIEDALEAFWKTQAVEVPLKK